MAATSPGAGSSIGLRGRTYVRLRIAMPINRGTHVDDPHHRWLGPAPGGTHPQRAKEYS